MDKKTQTNLLYVAIGIALIFLFQFWFASAVTEAIPYSDFLAMLQAGKFDNVTVTQNEIDGHLKQPDKSGTTMVQARRVDPATAQELSKYGVKFSAGADQSWLGTILSWIIPTALFFGLWVMIFRGAGGGQGLGGGLMSVGKSRAKVYVEKDIKVLFKDVAGIDEAKQELEEVVDFLKDPQGHGRLGARMPKGILLVGPPGTGKTLLARAVAGEAGVPFFSINGSEFVEMFVGVGAARVRDLFQQAQGHAPCIVFIDELDALGRARGFGPMSGGHDEKEQTLNQLLSEMDGFDPRQGVVLLAATNRPEILDPALLRAGRFDRQVLVDRPDKSGRLAILKIHTAKIKLAPDVSLAQIAAITVGFTGADLANLANEAALVATRRDGGDVTTEDFTAAFERIVAGLEKKNRVLNAVERQAVAFHEMGHALVSMSLPGTDAVHKVSIIPRGIGALGYTLQRPTEERFLMREEELENKLKVLLGGRAAEILVFGKNSTGAADDLAKATDLARSMVMQYGMDERLGQVSYEPKRLHFLENVSQAMPRQFSEETAREIDVAVRRLVENAFSEAQAILRSKRAILDRGARLLMEHETLQEADLRALIGGDVSPSAALPASIAVSA